MAVYEFREKEEGGGEREREREREGGREKGQFVVPLVYTFFGCFLYVP